MLEISNKSPFPFPLPQVGVVVVVPSAIVIVFLGGSVVMVVVSVPVCGQRNGCLSWFIWLSEGDFPDFEFSFWL